MSPPNPPTPDESIIRRFVVADAPQRERMLAAGEVSLDQAWEHDGRWWDWDTVALLAALQTPGRVAYTDVGRNPGGRNARADLLSGVPNEALWWLVHQSMGESSSRGELVAAQAPAKPPLDILDALPEALASQRLVRTIPAPPFCLAGLNGWLMVLGGVMLQAGDTDRAVGAWGRLNPHVIPHEIYTRFMIPWVHHYIEVASQAGQVLAQAGDTRRLGQLAGQAMVLAGACHADGAFSKDQDVLAGRSDPTDPAGSALAWLVGETLRRGGQVDDGAGGQRMESVWAHWEDQGRGDLGAYRALIRHAGLDATLPGGTEGERPRTRM